MDATVVNPIYAAPAQYVRLAEQQLQTAQEQFQQVAAHCAKSTSRYCAQECKLEQARAIQRAVTAIITGQRVTFSDGAALKHWLKNKKSF